MFGIICCVHSIRFVCVGLGVGSSMEKENEREGADNMSKAKLSP